MRNARCIYYVEGPCEEQLINALKEAPSKVLPGKVKHYNIVQKLIPKSQLLTMQAGTLVVLVFDTDVPHTDILEKNKELIGRYCRVKIIYLAQVRNLEDELARCTDVRNAPELTKSFGVRNFKTDFCKLKPKECRNLLERHNLDVNVLWTKEPPSSFSFIEKNSEKIKQV